MSLKDRSLLLIENDHTIKRLLLLGLVIAGPSLHYLCYYNSYDPFWLRALVSGICAVALAASFGGSKTLFKFLIYASVIGYLGVNNCLLLGVNGFEHVYLFSSITIFISLTLFCQEPWEFITISALNLVAVLVAYYTAPRLFISAGILIALLLVFSLIACVSFYVMMSYQRKFKNAIKEVMQLNESLLLNDEKLRASQIQLHAVISSVNDTIFELDENAVCINVWFGAKSPTYLSREQFLHKPLFDQMGAEEAKPLKEVYNYVHENRKPLSLEFPSLYGQDKWFMAKASPVFDVEGNYLNRMSVSVTDITEQKKRADALKESEALLRQAQTISKTGNWWYDTATRENFWSENLFNVLEIDAIPDGVDKFAYYMSLVHPDDQDRAVNYFKGISHQAEDSIQHKFITPKGNLKYLKVLRGEVLRDEHGGMQRVVGIIQDITEARLAEKAVKVSQIELLEAQAIAKIGNWRWDAATNMLSWSDEVNSIYEVDVNTIPASKFGRMLLQYVHPEDKYIVKYLFHNPDTVGTSYEYRIITPKGNTKYISVICGKLMYREDGSVRKIVGTLQDITQRKQAEIDHKITEHKYRTVLETIKLAAVSLDAQGTIIFCNKYLANLLGYSQTEIMGMNWMQNFVPEDLRGFMLGWFANNSVKTHYINPVICRNGETKVISWQNTISYDDNGKLMGTTSIGEDITLQQKVRQELISAKEKAERSSHFKSEFLSIMSHEIRTPMNAVIGTTNLLLSEDPRPEQLEYLNTLKFSGENLLAIINDILDYNKIEAGKLVLNKAPFNVHQLAQNIRQTFHAKAVEKHIDIELIADPSIPEFVLGDQVRLGQILLNLVNNAVKFTDRGKVTISINVQENSADDVMISFSVKDTGIGIAAENLTVIFDPFIQEHRAGNNDHGGTGLGLAITKRLVELYNSTINVSSELDKGTEFSFAIRFEVAGEVLQPARPAEATLPADLTGLSILVVDDNKMNVMIASKFLKKWGAIVDDAGDGRIAIEKVHANGYDLVIMDLQMPVMDGFEASLSIKGSFPDLPIIAFTADAMPETHNKAFEHGMCDYLTKPFVPEVLFSKILQHCRLGAVN